MNPYTTISDINQAQSAYKIYHDLEERANRIVEELKRVRDFLDHAPIEETAKKLPDLMNAIGNDMTTSNMKAEAHATMNGISSLVYSLGLGSGGETVSVVSNFVERQKAVMESMMDNKTVGVYADYAMITGKEVPSCSATRDVDTLTEAIAGAYASDDKKVRMETPDIAKVLLERVNESIMAGEGDHAFQKCAELRAALPDCEMRNAAEAVCDSLKERGFRLENPEEIKQTSGAFDNIRTKGIDAAHDLDIATKVDTNLTTP